MTDLLHYVIRYDAITNFALNLFIYQSILILIWYCYVNSILTYGEIYMKTS